MILRALTLLAILVFPGWAAAEPLRLLAFGDSLTEGYGLPARDGLVPRLRVWLSRRGHEVEIVNAGRAGETAADGMRRIGEELQLHEPDAVIVELGGNDLLRHAAPGRVERQLDHILTLAGAGHRPLLLVGIALPDPATPAARNWAAIWPRLAQKHDTLLVENLYAPFYALPRPRLRAMLQPDGLHPSAEGVGLIVESLGPKVEALILRVAAERRAAAQ